MLKQVGKPKFTANNETMGVQGQDAVDVQGRGRREGHDGALSRARIQVDRPAKTFDFTVKAKPGFTPKMVEAVDSYPAPTVFVKPGDQINVHALREGRHVGAAGHERAADARRSRRSTAARPS